NTPLPHTHAPTHTHTPKKTLPYTHTVYAHTYTHTHTHNPSAIFLLSQMFTLLQCFYSRVLHLSETSLSSHLIIPSITSVTDVILCRLSPAPSSPLHPLT